MAKISEEATKQLFTEGRTFSYWLPEEVSDQTLHDLYDLMKFGPTSANCCPIRIVFVKSAPEKERLLSAVAETNQPKVKAAPVTAIIAFDEKFYDQIPKLNPPSSQFREMFSANKELGEVTAFRNGSLEGGYFILAARAVGLDCGPMSGFDNKKLDEVFFKGTTWRSNFICNLGYGDKAKLHPRLPRLSFDEACKIV